MVPTAVPVWQMSTPDTIAEVTPLKRLALIAITAGLGSYALWFTTTAGTQLVLDLKRLPTAILFETSLGTALPLGIALCGFSLLGIFPPAFAQQRGGRDLSAPVVLTGLVCLLAAPVLTVGLRIGVASYLEARGYQGKEVDYGFRAKFPTIRYTRSR